jgi:hypothetical protein
MKKLIVLVTVFLILGSSVYASTTEFMHQGSRLFVGRKIASANAITVSAQLAVSGYSIKIDGWKSDSEVISPFGSRFVTVINSSNEAVENKVVLNNNYDKSLMDGGGTNYDIIICMGDTLKTLGGIEGFANKLGQLTGGKIAPPTKLASNYDFAVALVGNDGKIKLIDTAKLAIQPR